MKAAGKARGHLTAYYVRTALPGVRCAKSLSRIRREKRDSKHQTPTTGAQIGPGVCKDMPWPESLTHYFRKHK